MTLQCRYPDTIKDILELRLEQRLHVSLLLIPDW